MKKFYIISTLILFLFHLSTQAQSKRMIIGGTIGFKYSNKDVNQVSFFSASTETIVITGSPFWGYHLSDHVVIGAGLEYNFQRSSLKNGNQTSLSYAVAFTPFLRYFFNSSLFIQPQVYLGESFQEFHYNLELDNQYSDVNFDSKFLFFGTGLALGYDIHLTDNVKLEPMVKYLYQHFMNSAAQENYTDAQLLLNLDLIYKFH